MLDDLTIADPAEETQEASGDTSGLMLESAQDGETSAMLFSSPVLDRIRTSD